MGKNSSATLLWTALMGLLVTTGARARQNPSQAPAELTAAAAAERSGNYEVAARDYRDFLSKAAPSTPSSALTEIRTRLATALFMLHRYRDSLHALNALDFTSGGRSASLSGQAWLVRGLDELELNQLPEAVRSLRKALVVNPASGTARLALGDALARRGELERAADAYRDELQRAPKTADAWYKLGSVYEELSGKFTADLVRQQPDQIVTAQLSAERMLDRGDSWGAAKTLFPVVQQHPSTFQPGLQATFGAALLQLGYPNAAEREFKAELARDPGCLPASLGMAEIEMLRSNWDSALVIFNRLMTLYPQELARELESPPAGPLTEAIKKKALNVPPELVSSPTGKLISEWIESGGLASEPQSDSAARPCARPPSAAEISPGYWMSEACVEEFRRDLHARTDLSADQRSKLAETEYRLGRYENAVEDGRALLRQASADPWAYYWLARSYSALGAMCFEKLAEVGPDSARVHEILARYHSEHQQLPAARREYEAALRLEPGLPDLQLGLGTVDWQSGDWARAEAELTRALELSPGSAVAAYELGDCYVQQHQWQAAVKPLKSALSDADVERRARLDLAKVEAELGDSDAAIKNLLVLSSKDSDGEIHYRLAMLYRKSGDPKKADEALIRSEVLRKASDQVSQRQIEELEGDTGATPPSSSARPPKE
jgi:tetratricopeptide (TPR) repeat protein